MKQHGLDAPSNSMILVNLFQLLYVVDGLWNEVMLGAAQDKWEITYKPHHWLWVSSSGGHSNHHGLNAWWFWLHVGLWWSGVGSLYLHHAGILPGQSPQPAEPPSTRSHRHPQTWVEERQTELNNKQCPGSVSVSIERNHSSCWCRHVLLVLVFQSLDSTSSENPTPRRTPSGETRQTPDCLVSPAAALGPNMNQ